MRRTALTLFVFFLLFFSILSHAALAVMSIEEERKLGKQLLGMVKEQVSIVKDPEITEYVSGLGRKVMEQVEGRYFDYQFFVIQDPGINAFAMPGGLVFVHSGLIAAIDSENDLVCVLAHEIGHIQGRHIVRRMDAMQKINLASAAVAVAGLFLGGGNSGSAVLATTGALNMSFALKYSRIDEEEADRRACQWICKAGYHPQGLISVMRKILQSRWIGSDTIPSYLSTHPASSERITYLEDILASSNCPGKNDTDSFRFQRVKVKTDVATGRPSVLVRTFRQRVAEHPGDLFSRYGLALALLKAQELDESRKIMEELIQERPNDPEFLVDLGRIHLSAGRYTDAVRTLEEASRRLPDDPACSYYLASGLLELGEARKALSLLQSIEPSWPDPGGISLLIGRAYSSLGDKGRTHYYLYRHYQEEGDKEAARFHKKMAKKLLGPEDKLLREIDETEDPEESADPSGEKTSFELP
ncbi:MAG: M48 family metalloprotease [Deltaproteobacteria bacterium]